MWESTLRLPNLKPLPETVPCQLEAPVPKSGLESGTPNFESEILTSHIPSSGGVWVEGVGLLYTQHPVNPVSLAILGRDACSGPRIDTGSALVKKMLPNKRMRVPRAPGVGGVGCRGLTGLLLRNLS